MSPSSLSSRYGGWLVLAITSLLCLPPLAQAKPKPKAPPVPKIDPEWYDRGIDTTQPGWYRKHPFWKHIAVPFHQECDRIVARLQDSLPKPGVPRDTVVLQYKGPLDRELRYTGSVFPFKGMGLILRPQLLRATPKSSPVTALIRPEEGPWRVLSLFNCKYSACEYPMAESDLGQPKKWAWSTVSVKSDFTDRLYDRSNEAATVAQVFQHSKWGLMELPHPDAMGLVATRSGQPLGWISLDSIAIFSDSVDVLVSAPFYQEGIATYMHGAWKTPPDRFGDRCIQRREDPIFHMGAIWVNDMIHLWRIFLVPKNLEILAQEDPESLPRHARNCLRNMKIDLRACPGITPTPSVSLRCMETMKWDTLSLSEYNTTSGWKGFRRIDGARIESYEMNNGKKGEKNIIQLGGCGIELDVNVGEVPIKFDELEKMNGTVILP